MRLVKPHRHLFFLEVPADVESSKLSAVAKAVSIDQQTSEASLFSLIDGIESQQVPFLIPEIAFFALLKRDAADQATYDVDFTVQLDDQILLSQAIRVQFGESVRNKNVVRIGGLVIPHSGTLKFRLAIDGEELTSYSVGIVLKVAGPAVATEQAVPP